MKVPLLSKIGKGKLLGVFLLVGGIAAGILFGFGVLWLLANDSRLTGFNTTETIETGPEVGKLAPDFSLPKLDGETLSLSSFHGRPVLINFWASWCPPCRIEMPDLVRTYEANRDTGFVILGIDLAFQDSIPEVESFVEEFELTFPVLLDETGDVTNDLYQLRGLPMSVFVDRDGVIRRIHLGAMTGGQIEAFMDELLNASY